MNTRPPRSTRTDSLCPYPTLFRLWFSWDTELGRDVTIEPNVVFGPGVTIADNVIVKAYSHIEGATIAAGFEVGPFARLRPGTVLGEKAKIGNFVETQTAEMGKGAKAKHLNYLGALTVGATAKLDAATQTANNYGNIK